MAIPSAIVVRRGRRPVHRRLRQQRDPRGQRRHPVIITVAGNGLIGYSGDNGPATAAELNGPQSIASDAAGDLFIADTGNNVIREVDAATHVITTVAGSASNGDGGQATAANLSGPSAVAVDSAGDVFILESAGEFSQLVAGPDSIPMQSAGPDVVREINAVTHVITTVAGNGNFGYSGDNGPATAAELGDPTAIAVDAAGDLFIADTDNDVIREVNLVTGIITTVAGSYGNNGYSGDNGPATAASLAYPTAIAVDVAGNLFIDDSGNNVIREVNASTQIITTVAGTYQNYGYGGDGGLATSAELNAPQGIAVDAAGNLFISDTYNNVIREVNAVTQAITTVAGMYGQQGDGGDNGPAATASVGFPGAIALDAAGDLFIDEADNGVIREINAVTHVITTVAGSGLFGFSGDGGPATAAELNYPEGIALDAGGDLYIADTFNLRVREAAVGLSITVDRATPSVTVTDAGGLYNGSAFAAMDTVAGVVSGVDTTPAASLEGVYPSLIYYSGTSATGTTLSGAPVSAGTYTVLASFAGSSDYASAGASTTFTISGGVHGTPTLTVTDAGGTYNDAAFAATGTVQDGASLEGVYPSLTYYSGTSAMGTALAGAPSTVGTYSVLASFAGSTNYTSAAASTSFTISQAAAMVTPADASGAYTSSAFQATETVAGAGAQSTPSASLEGVTPSLTYYSGVSATGTALDRRSKHRGHVHGAGQLRRQHGLHQRHGEHHVHDQPGRCDGTRDRHWRDV